MPTGFNTVETANKVYETFFSKNYISFYITATGYGRVSAKFANQTLTEILCHSVGANFFYSQDCIVIDVGGQDTKVSKSPTQSLKTL